MILDNYISSTLSIHFFSVILENVLVNAKQVPSDITVFFSKSVDEYQKEWRKNLHSFCDQLLKYFKNIPLSISSSISEIDDVKERKTSIIFSQSSKVILVISTINAEFKSFG